MTKDDKNTMTASDLAENVDKVCRAVDHSGLSQLVKKLHATLPKHNARICLALVANKDGVVEIKNPSVSFRPSHIMLTDEAARGFELHSWLLSNINQCVGQEPLPLELFSIKHMVDDKFSQIMEWTNSPVITPANRITMYLKRRQDTPPDVEFRGLLWGYYALFGEDL